MYQIISYIIYLTISLVTILVVGKSLHHNGNNFLYIGYCLVNTGFAFYFLNSTHQITNLIQLLDFIALSEGTVFLSLGILHIINVILAPRIISFFLMKKIN